MNETLQKHLEYEFHSASYHTMVEVVIALRTAAGHLDKVLSWLLHIEFTPVPNFYKVSTQ